MLIPSEFIATSNPRKYFKSKEILQITKILDFENIIKQLCNWEISVKSMPMRTTSSAYTNDVVKEEFKCLVKRG